MLQLIASDTPSVPVETDEWFCILLLRLPAPSETAKGSAPAELGWYEPMLEQTLAQISLSAVPVQYWQEYVVLFCLLENAAYFLAFRAGKDHSMTDITPMCWGNSSAPPIWSIFPNKPSGSFKCWSRSSAPLTAPYLC
ncbi:MAG: hypothetical protein PUC06_11385 [Oscillospiraceae bacterium]|nr:hypothetical protein [Oscillospiraceae bacterium]